MSRRMPLHLFQGYGVELEYMIVDRHTLAVLPIADLLLNQVAGQIVNEVDHGELCWSNELALHVVELKTNGPAKALDSLSQLFGEQVAEINGLLEPYGGMLMPGAMHPWMNPDKECRLWPHGNRSIYEAYDRIFGCQGHGWSNLQSAHLNLPFADDIEFGRLHAAVRLVLPLLPSLSAASPVMNGRPTGLLDNRLEVYRFNQAKIPSITGQVIPEAVFTPQDYKKVILETMYRDIAFHDRDGVLQEEWLNSRGAIARFDRNTIEIRLLDVQECPAADLAIQKLVVSVLKELVGESNVAWPQQKLWHESFLASLFASVLKEGQRCRIDDSRFLGMFGFNQSNLSVNELWKKLAERLIPQDDPSWVVLRTIFEEGPLAQRLLVALGAHPDNSRLVEVYRKLCDCLQQGVLFHG
ncbi:MAG: glutamate--cysteine ligase [Deltaproteobacteria bacterium]|jgi:gamma-glutamyl:cysteine ligase YbdK (ATP-grasp superfamily)|nr:glutamate--cysteine ligase [Deltaproteobacteria bacterium]